MAEFPDAVPHGDIEEVFPNIFVVTGEVSLPMPLGLRCSFSRNMTIVKQNTDLILINTVRLSESGLAKLDALGEVKHILKIAGFHGKDDPFYKDRYGAIVWALQGSGYNRGFEYDPENMYFQPDEWITEGSSLPISNASMVVMNGEKPPAEAVIFLRNESILIVGDSLQNIEKNDPYINFVGSWVMYLMGFFTPHNVGPAWSQSIKISGQVLIDKLLSLEFDHVIPAHGAVVKGDGWRKYEKAIRAMKKW